MSRAGPIENYVFTPHAAMEMQRRGIDEETVRRILAAPEQRFPVRAGRDLFQSRIRFGGRDHLVHVFVDVDRSPAEVVTAYRTSKVDKYWRNES